MKEDSSPRANDVLRRVRGSANPQPRDEARVLARVEQRLGMISQLEVFREPVRRVNGGARGHASSAGMGAPLQQLLGALPRAGLWAAFGVSMAAIGYGLGTRGKESQREEVAAVVRSSETVVVPASVGATPVSAPVVSALVVAAPAVVPAPVIAAPVVSAPAMSLSRRPGPLKAAARSATADDDAANATMAPSATTAPGATVAPRAAAVTAEPEAIGLREALQLLERAQAAVRLGTAGDALDWLGQLERRKPGRLLEQERLVTRALAQCLLGEVAQARATRRQLERLEPESIYRGQLDASCAKKE